ERSAASAVIVPPALSPTSATRSGSTPPGGGVLPHLYQCAEDIIGRCRHRDPRAEEAVLYRDHDSGQARGEVAGQPVALYSGTAVATAVHVQHQGKGAGAAATGTVHPDR